MVQYKWVALSNTTIGALMASIDGTIVLISLPAIFRGINIDPLLPSSFQYLLWMLFGYSVVTSTLLVTFGRISDMFGRVRLYNLGFLIFTIGSTLLSVTPSTGDLGGIELIGFRVIQGIGGAFLLANSAAIITDAFPPTERGRALGINMVAVLAGSLVGLILGGVLAVINWRLVFLVSVPVGILGTAWSYLKLKEKGIIKKNQKIDIWGNATFGIGLTLILVGITYALQPYGAAAMGWTSPWVIASLGLGALLLAAFPFIERRVPNPMFKFELFKNRQFTAANIAGMIAAIGRGGVQIMLIILLQGIWLPLHGYSYDVTPFWSGIYITPMLLGFVVMGPVSGAISDRRGAKSLATLGMGITAASFLALSLLPYNFSYPTFAGIIFVMGLGGGMFAAPNITSIMNSVPPENRGAASGMRATLQNTGQTISLAIFFTIIISALSGSLPGALSAAVAGAGAPPAVASLFSRIPATEALFAVFLGASPVRVILSVLPASVLQTIPSSTISFLTGTSFFPNAIAPAFMSALRISFYIGAGLAVIAAVASLMRGRMMVYAEQASIKTEEAERKEVAAPAPKAKYLRPNAEESAPTAIRGMLKNAYAEDSEKGA